MQTRPEFIPEEVREKIQSSANLIHMYLLCATEEQINAPVSSAYWATQTYFQYYVTSRITSNYVPTFAWDPEEKNAQLLFKRKLEFLRNMLSGSLAQAFVQALLQEVDDPSAKHLPSNALDYLKSILLTNIENSIQSLNLKIKASVKAIALHPDLSQSLLDNAESVGLIAAAEAIDTYLERAALARKEKMEAEQEAEKIKLLSTGDIRAQLERNIEENKNNQSAKKLKEENKIAPLGVSVIQPGTVRNCVDALKKQSIFDTRPKDVPDHQESFEDAKSKLADFFSSTIGMRQPGK